MIHKHYVIKDKSYKKVLKYASIYNIKFLESPEFRKKEKKYLISIAASQDNITKFIEKIKE